MHSVGSIDFDLNRNSLLASTFSSPNEVLENPILSHDEKRCVLAAWASDAFAVEGKPWLRQLPHSDTPIPLAAIFAALRRLDDNGPPPGGGVPMRLGGEDFSLAA